MSQKRRVAAVVAVALCAVFALLPTAGARVSMPGRGIMLPADPSKPLAQHNATEDSVNWSGYVDLPVAGHKITGVESTHVVPSVDGTTPGFAATWAGIGGYNSQDLIQAGVGEEYVPGLGKNYYAWYEILPASETQIANCTGDLSCTVRPGDVVTVTINTTGAIQANQTWHIAITDAGHWSYVKDLTYASTYSSAEWVLEAPTVGAQTVMPMMSTTLFDPNNTYNVDNGTAQNVASGGPVLITMNNREGLPSALDADGDGFNACAYKLSCAPPAS